MPIDFIGVVRGSETFTGALVASRTMNFTGASGHLLFCTDLRIRHPMYGHGHVHDLFSLVSA
jgi:hypothetical protein